MRRAYPWPLHFLPGHDQVRATLAGLMPRLLTDGKRDEASAALSPKAQVLEICAKMTGKTWKKDVALVAELLRKM